MLTAYLQWLIVLLADENGAYYRLAKAQTLREGREDDGLDATSSSDELI